jgi:hypothetical protein
MDNKFGAILSDFEPFGNPTGFEADFGCVVARRSRRILATRLAGRFFTERKSRSEFSLRISSYCAYKCVFSGENVRFGDVGVSPFRQTTLA